MSGKPKTGRLHTLLKGLLVGICCLLVGYLLVMMYAQGEYLFAILALILSTSGIWIYANRRAYAWRYVYPGIAGMALFVLFPLACTVAIAFTNYSSTNQLTFERAQQVLLSRYYQSGESVSFSLFPAGDRWQLVLTEGDETFVSPFCLWRRAAAQNGQCTAACG